MAENQQMHYSAVFVQLIGYYQTKLKGKIPEDSMEFFAKKTVEHAFRDYLLLCYSESIRAKRSTPWEPLIERQGAELIATEKYSWLPEQVRAMSNSELLFALNAEIQTFQMPEDALDACHSWLNRFGLNSYIKHLQTPSKANELDD